VRARARQAPGFLWADGAHLDPRLVRAEAREDAVRSRSDVVERAVVCDRREDDVRGVGDVARRVAPEQPGGHESLRVRARAARPVHRVAGGEKPVGHRAAHAPEADEADGAAFRGRHQSYLLHRRSFSVFRPATQLPGRRGSRRHI